MANLLWKEFHPDKIQRCACGCGGITGPGKRYILGHYGKVMSEETKVKMALAHIKPNADYEYCEEWHDREYKNDLRKDYCENVDCKGTYKRLNNHHINLNKKDCRPLNVMTLCNPCHSFLHGQLGLNTNHKDYLTIIRKDRIVYIHKKTKKKIILKRVAKDTV